MVNTRANEKTLVGLTDSQMADLKAFFERRVREVEEARKSSVFVAKIKALGVLTSMLGRVREVNSMRRAVSDLKSRPVCRCGDRTVMVVIDVEKQRPDPKVIADIVAQLNQSLAESE